MENECPVCGGVVVLRKDKDIQIVLPNPGLKIIKSDCYECIECGEEIFDETQGTVFANKIDDIIAYEQR